MEQTPGPDVAPRRYYLRLAVAHLGVRGWQGCYAPCGADPVARQWLRLYCPERLHASDRASAPAATEGPRAGG